MLKGDVLEYAAARTGTAAPTTIKGGIVEDSMGVAIEDVGVGLRQQHQGDSQGLAALGAQAKTPSMAVRHDNDDDGWGSLSELIPGSVVGRSFESSKGNEKTAARRNPKTLAVGVEVVEGEEGQTRTGKSSGVREVKQPVPLPIKGDATWHKQGVGGIIVMPRGRKCEGAMFYDMADCLASGVVNVASRFLVRLVRLALIGLADDDH